MKRRFLYRVFSLAIMLSCWWHVPAVAQDLGLKLVGTAVSDDPKQNYAVIESLSAGGQQKTYREGDQVGGILIKKIFLGKVLVQTSRGETLLSMRSGDIRTSPSEKPANGGLYRKELDSVLPDYSHLMQQIRVQPYYEGGRPTGFVIYSIAPGSLFERMGLKNEDVIKGVNGSPFRTTRPVMEFYDALREGGTITLDILRDKTVQKLLFEIQ